MFGIERIKAVRAAILNAVSIKTHNVKKDKTSIINGIIYLTGLGRIEIGKDSRINSGIQFNPIGGDSRCILNTRNNGRIIIGDHTGISNSTIVAESLVQIGNYVLIGGNCKIYDTDFHSLEYERRIQYPDPNVKVAPVVIKDGAFIGANSIILKGVSIGEKSIIGAGSVVTKNIPDGEIWGGNPAKFIRKID